MYDKCYTVYDARNVISISLEVFVCKGNVVCPLTETGRCKTKEIV